MAGSADRACSLTAQEALDKSVCPGAQFLVSLDMREEPRSGAPVAIQFREDVGEFPGRAASVI